jgi:hypothetical protein
VLLLFLQEDMQLFRFDGVPLFKLTDSTTHKQTIKCDSRTQGRIVAGNVTRLKSVDGAYITDLLMEASGEKRRNFPTEVLQKKVGCWCVVFCGCARVHG